MSTEEPRTQRRERLLIAGVVAGGIAGAMALGAVLQHSIANLNGSGGGTGSSTELIRATFEEPNARELDLRIAETAFGPDVMLTENFSSDKPATIWARIEAEDAHGVTVDGLAPGDDVTIESISGHGWFAGTPGWQLAVSAIVGPVTDVLASKDVAKSIGSAWTKINEGRGNRDGEEAQGRSKQRDGWGRDEDGDFSQNEGGIIVCFPRSRGPFYAYDEHHLQDGARGDGRLKTYVPDALKRECFFPVRFEGKTELCREAKDSGVLHILAWDNNYRDNSGDYDVKFRITRNGKANCGAQ